MHAPSTKYIHKPGEPRKIIAIVGATGRQGGGLATAILNEGKDSEFAVRAITRDTTSEKARLLQKLGTDVVQANINNENEIKEAVKGCYGMYCVTFYWEHMDPDEELRQASNMAKAAKEAGVKHVIWSTLEDSRMLLSDDDNDSERVQFLDGGKYKVPQFDVKAEANDFFADLNLPTTYLVTSFYYDNFLHFEFAPQKEIGDEVGKLVLRLPISGNRHLAAIAAEDIGKCALGIFKHPEDYINKRVGIMGESLTGVEIVAKMSKALRKEVHFEEMSFDEFHRRHQFAAAAGAKQLANMFRFFSKCETEILTTRDVAESFLLNENLMSFDQWLAKYKNFIPIN